MTARACTWQCRCGVKYSVLSNDPDLRLLSDRFKCWNTHPPCRYYFHRNDKLTPGPAVRAIIIFQMIQGVGAPDERKCSPVDLRKRILGKRVTNIAVTAAPDRNRSLITSITLEGGLTVHLATSTRGATVYKVTNE